jgi:hypothetical protein
VAALLTAMTRSPGNLANLVTHAADLEAAAVLLGALLTGQMLAQDALIAAGDDVRTVVVGGVHMRVAELLTAMTRAPVNMGNLVANVADLEVAATALNDAPSVVRMLGADHCLANGATVRATVAGLTHIPAAAVSEAMATGLAQLNTLHARRVDIDRALTGQNGITGPRLLGTVAHITGNAALPVLAADLDPQLRFAQSLGAQLRHILLTPLGQPVNVAHLRNLALAVDTQVGVAWGNVGGTFNSGGGGGGVNFGANIRVPISVTVAGVTFALTNHVIAHLIDPRDNAHRIRISHIRTALNNYAGDVNDYAGWRSWYQGNGLRLITPRGVNTIVTIFFG